MTKRRKDRPKSPAQVEWGSRLVRLAVGIPILLFGLGWLFVNLTSTSPQRSPGGGVARPGPPHPGGLGVRISTRHPRPLGSVLLQLGRDGWPGLWTNRSSRERCSASSPANSPRSGRGEGHRGRGRGRAGCSHAAIGWFSGGESRRRPDCNIIRARGLLRSGCGLQARRKLTFLLQGGAHRPMSQACSPRPR